MGLQNTSAFTYSISNGYKSTLYCFPNLFGVVIVISRTFFKKIIELGYTYLLLLEVSLILIFIWICLKVIEKYLFKYLVIL